MAALGALIGAAMVHGGVFAMDWTFALFAGSAAAFLITAFGNVLNDIVDRDVDQVAHPHRALPRGAISPDDAKMFAGLCLGVGLLEALMANPFALAFATANVLLLVLYEWRLKRLPLVGNVAVGLLVASVFPFGAVAATGEWPTALRLWGLTGLAFLVNVARELWKDVQDRDADAGRRTFAQAREASALRAGQGLVIAAVMLSAPFLLPWTPASVLLLLADAFFVAAVVGASDIRRAQRGLKLAMFLALLAFAV